MGLYRVEIFTKKFELVHHDMIDENELMIDDDCLAPDVTSISVSATTKIKRGYLCRIVGNSLDFCGIVCGVDDGNEYITSIEVKPFVSVFDHLVRFDTRHMGTTYTLENELKNLITEYWINTRDDDPSQEFSRITVNTVSSTSKWKFDINPTDDGIPYTLVNLYTDLIVEALREYGIAITTSFNWKSKTITIQIGKRNSGFIINADLDDVTINEFNAHTPSSSTNKFELWNSENYTDAPIYYYVYSDGTCGTDKTKNRVTPVNLEVDSVNPVRENVDGVEKITKTFAQAAKEYVDNFIQKMSFTDNVELTTTINNTIVKPLSHNYGDVMYVIYKGVRYSCILTGRKYDSTGVTMVFGSIRNDYTKRIRLEKSK